MNLRNNPNDNTQQIFLDILAGIKEKFFNPVLNENKRLTIAINKMQENEEKSIAELIGRIERLEKKVDESPIIILSALRDAINHSFGGSENGSNQST